MRRASYMPRCLAVLQVVVGRQIWMARSARRSVWARAHGGGRRRRRVYLLPVIAFAARSYSAWPRAAALTFGGWAIEAAMAMNARCQHYHGI